MAGLETLADASQLEAQGRWAYLQALARRSHVSRGNLRHRRRQYLFRDCLRAGANCQRAAHACAGLSLPVEPDFGVTPRNTRRYRGTDLVRIGCSYATPRPTPGRSGIEESAMSRSGRNPRHPMKQQLAILDGLSLSPDRQPWVLGPGRPLVRQAVMTSSPAASISGRWGPPRPRSASSRGSVSFLVTAYALSQATLPTNRGAIGSSPSSATPSMRLQCRSWRWPEAGRLPQYSFC
jgi:hypothetical protein